MIIEPSATMKYKLLFIILSIFALRTSFGIWKLWQSRGIVRDAKMRLEKAKLDNKKLTERLSEVQSDEFVEREARDKLGYGKPGETILILPNQNSAQYTEKGTQENKSNWRRWCDLYIRI